MQAAGLSDRVSKQGTVIIANSDIELQEVRLAA